MQLEIVEKKENKLLEREALIVRGTHEGPTPTRLAVKQAVVTKLKVPADQVMVRAMSTRFGDQGFSAEVHVYKTAQRAQQIEPAKFKKKNAPAEASKEKTEQKETKAPAAEKEEASAGKEE